MSLVLFIIKLMNQSCKLKFHGPVESLNCVTLWVVQRSRGSSDIKGIHCDLKNMCNVGRTII